MTNDAIVKNRTHAAKGFQKNLHFALLQLFLFTLLIPTNAFGQSAAGQPDQLSWKQEFDATGRLARLINPAGEAITYSYAENAGGTSTVIKTDGYGEKVQFETDQNGRLMSMTDRKGRAIYRYDEMGRISQLQRENELPVGYSWDLQNRLTLLTVGEQYQTGYAYDFLGRISKMTTPAGEITYSYQAGQGTVTRTLPNGIQTIWEFDVNGQLLKLTHIDNRNFILLGFQYQYRPDGLIQTIRESSTEGKFLTSCFYDQVGRLIRAERETGEKYEYNYDQMGNCLASYMPGERRNFGKYDWAGRLIDFNGKPCTHDAGGNLTSLSKNGKNLSYRYNTEGQLQSAGDAVEYNYDGNGLLTGRATGGMSEKYIVNPLAGFWQPLVKEGDNPVHYYWDANAPLIVMTGNQPAYILTDHLGSARMILDQNGKRKAFLRYDPFGEPLQKGDGSGLEPGFAGLFYDRQAEVYLTQARAYNPALGQFMQIEPLKQIPTGSQKELTLYAYCGNDPVNFIDIDGNFTVPFMVWSAITSIGFYGPQFATRITPLISRVSTSLTRLIPPINAARDIAVKNVFNLTTQVKATLNLNLNLIKENYTNINNNIQRFKAETELLYNTMVSPLKNTANDRISEQFISSDVKLKIYLRSLENSSNQLGNLGDYKSLYPKMTKTQKLITGIPVIADIANKYTRNFTENFTTHHSSITPGSGKNIPSFINTRNSGISNVGGVYLGGAGRNLEGMARIEGLSLDQNNNLVLTGEKGDPVDLPPIRLDDLVTIFRAVYLQGTGPTVTIDPSPVNPNASAMIIKHDEETRETYVGWILYQCDRIMKCYMLGSDNNTAQDFTSKIPGYQAILDSLYFGGFSNSSKPEGKWERFWIIPAETRQYLSKDSSLTLFDVPLKLKTQLMKWENGNLQNDSTGQSTPGAKSYTRWFTVHYDDIADEQFLLPPPETGIKEPVAIFKELKRFALITAIAEQMRSQQIPMPFWMRNYEVKKITFEKITPGLQIDRGNGIMTTRIFGGVVLKPEKKAVRQFTKVPDSKEITTGDKKMISEGLALSDGLSEAVTRMPEIAQPLEVQTIELDQVIYQATEIPGSGTLALAPNLLEETDLTVPVTESQSISLTRHFNSFFNPQDCWGNSWTMDLPEMIRIQVPVENKSGSTSYREGFELVTPLNSVYARFSTGKLISTYMGKITGADQEGDILGMAFDKPDFLNDTTISLILKNGVRWFFTEEGTLIAMENGGFRTVYLRDRQNQVSQIVGIAGNHTLATIDLRYDVAGRLTGATGKNGLGFQREVQYSYDPSGKMSLLKTGDGTIQYTYDQSLVKGIIREGTSATGSPATAAERDSLFFEYNANGQLLSQIPGKHNGFEFRLEVDKTTGSQVLGYQSDQSSGQVTYDASLRPVTAKYADGTEANWTYPEAGGQTLEIRGDDGSFSRITETAAQDEIRIETAGQPTFTELYEPAGQLKAVKLNDQPLYTLKWHDDGGLESLITSDFTLSPQYNPDKSVKSILQYHPEKDGKLRLWQETQLDWYERPVGMTDYSGLKSGLVYDEKGQIRQFTTERNGQTLGYTFSRDQNGNIQSVRSSWDTEEYRYDPGGLVSNIRVTVPTAAEGKLTSSLDFSKGLLNRITQFDGGKTEISYHSNPAWIALPEKISCPNGLQLTYHYTKEGEISSVFVGNERKMQVQYDADGRLTEFGISKNQ